MLQSDQLTELMQASIFFANLGLDCPWVGEDAWCSLDGEHIYGDLLPEYDADKRRTENRAVHCPPAVDAAIVDFGKRVEDRLWTRDIYANVSTTWDDRTDHYTYVWAVESNHGETNSRIEAYTSLLIAAWREMGGDDDTE